MKVLTVHDDHAILDLVMHFLGIATHHNVNAAPSPVTALKLAQVFRQTFKSAHALAPSCLSE